MGLLKGKHSKKVPQDSNELERFLIFEQIRSVQKQVNFITKGLFVSKLRIFSLFLFSALIVLNDWMDLLTENQEVVMLGTKIAFSALLVLIALYVLKSYREVNNLVMERLYFEKRANSRTQRNNSYLCSFQSKIVTHLKASPADFCKILTNPLYYKNFKFDLPIP